MERMVEKICNGKNTGPLTLLPVECLMATNCNADLSCMIFEYKLGLFAQPKGGRGSEAFLVPNPLNSFFLYFAWNTVLCYKTSDNILKKNTSSLSPPISRGPGEDHGSFVPKALSAPPSNLHYPSNCGVSCCLGWWGVLLSKNVGLGFVA